MGKIFFYAPRKSALPGTEPYIGGGAVQRPIFSQKGSKLPKVDVYRRNSTSGVD